MAYSSRCSPGDDIKALNPTSTHRPYPNLTVMQDKNDHHLQALKPSRALRIQNLWQKVPAAPTALTCMAVVLMWARLPSVTSGDRQGGWCAC